MVGRFVNRAKHRWGESLAANLGHRKAVLATGSAGVVNEGED